MEPVRLHLGCGKRKLKGYIHVDHGKFPHLDYNQDIRFLPMFKDNSVDLIYASHVLEYFDRVEVLAVLKEWKRVLKKGGILRLAVPDYEALIKVYRKTKDLNKVLGPLFGRWAIAKTKFIIYHKTVYDFASLNGILLQSGFNKVRRWDWRKVFVKELQGYDDYSQAYFPHMDQKGILISLNVEAQK